MYIPGHFREDDQSILQDSSATTALAYWSHSMMVRPLPQEYLEKMMCGIVYLTIPVSRLEGKYKMSQNRTAHEQARVIEALQESNPEVANVMRDVGRQSSKNKTVE